MKILKINLGLFSLLAIFATTVFLTSCEQDDILSETLTDEVLLSKSKGEVDESEFFLPFGYDDLSEEAKEKYLNELDHQKVVELVESTKIAEYFAHLEKYEALKKNSKYGDVFNENTLSSLLSPREIQNYASGDFKANIGLRGCGAWFNVGSPCWCYCAYYYYGACYEWRCAQKQKKICSWWPDKYRYVGSYQCY